MALVRINHIALRGVAATVPSLELNNSDYDRISVQDRLLFIKTTGIEKRRVAASHISTGDMCYHASISLLKKMEWAPEEIDAIITVTQSPDHFIPGTAVILQNRLGIKKSCVAFDINLGCSGYVYGLYVLGSLMQSGNIRKALLCAGDKSTLSTSYEDKSTYPLFGDAGSATALEYDLDAEPMWFNLHSDGGGQDAITILDGGSRNGVSEDTFKLKEVAPGIKRARRHLQLNGVEVFNFALREVPSSIITLYEFSEKSMEKTDYFFFHQANKLINESVRKKLKNISPEQFPYSIQQFGNTSSASVPLTMVNALTSNNSRENLELCLCGFGVGFSWASCVISTKNLVCVPLIELD